MMCMLFLAMAKAADPVEVLAEVGDALPGAIVERVELHPEYQRYWLRHDDGGGIFPAELTRSAVGFEGLCEAHGLALYPREELGEGPRPADPLLPVRALCARLADHPVGLRARVGGDPAATLRSTEPVPDPASYRLQLYPLHVVVVAWLCALLVAVVGPARRAWAALGNGEHAELVGVTLLGVAVRFALSPDGIFNGGGAAYEKIVLAWAVDVDSPYGLGYPALLGPILAVFGREPRILFEVVRAWACFAPPLLWIVARLVAGGTRVPARAAALGSGLALALLPVHVGMSATEAMHVPVLTLELLSVAAAAAALRASGRELALVVLAALSAGLAAHTRPEAMVFAAVPAAMLLLGRVRGGWLGVALLVACVAARLPLGAETHAADALRGATFPGPRFGTPREASSFSVFLHAGLTPPVLWAFALAGVVFAPWRLRVLVLTWWVCTELPVLAKVLPLADAWRLQLVAQPAWLLLVGAGTAGLFGRLGAWGLAACLAVVLARTPPGPDWAHQREFAFLARTVPDLGRGDTVLFEDSASRYAKFQRVMEVVGPARWVPASTWLTAVDSPAPSVVYLGLGCVEGDAVSLCAEIRRRCRLSPLQETTLGPPADLDVHLPADGARIGLYRVSSCVSEAGSSRSPTASTGQLSSAARNSSASPGR